MNVQSPVLKTVGFAVDDGPSVLAAIAGDLRSAYGERSRVPRAGSGQDALRSLREPRLRGEGSMAVQSLRHLAGS